MARSRWGLRVYVSRPWWARPPKRAAKTLFWSWLNRRRG